MIAGQPSKPESTTTGSLYQPDQNTRNVRNAQMRPSKTWGWSGCSPKRPPSPALGDGPAFPGCRRAPIGEQGVIGQARYKPRQIDETAGCRSAEIRLASAGICKMVMTVIGFRPVRPILNTASWQRSSGLVRLQTMAAPVTAVINILDPAIIASPLSRTVACVLPKQGGAQRPKRGSICHRQWLRPGL